MEKLLPWSSLPLNQALSVSTSETSFTQQVYPEPDRERPGPALSPQRQWKQYEAGAITSVTQVSRPRPGDRFRCAEERTSDIMLLSSDALKTREWRRVTERRVPEEEHGRNGMMVIHKVSESVQRESVSNLEKTVSSPTLRQTDRKRSTPTRVRHPTRFRLQEKKNFRRRVKGRLMKKKHWKENQYKRKKGKGMEGKRG